MKGIHSAIGKVLIENALSTFDSAAKNLEYGITHLQADKDKHRQAISESSAKINELDSHIDRATRVIGRIKAFTE